MKKPKLQEMVDERMYYQTDKSWKFGLSGESDGDEDYHQFGIVYEITNMADATGEPEFEEYPYVVSASIMAHKCHESYNDMDEGCKPDLGTLRYDCLQYMGGVPIDHDLSLAITNVGEKGEAFEALVEQFSPMEAKVVTTKQDFGTWAAQRGKGSQLRYMQFRTYEAAYKYCELLAARAPAMALLIGFTLDRPVNMMGDDGWSIVKKHLKGHRS